MNRYDILCGSTEFTNVHMYTLQLSASLLLSWRHSKWYSNTWFRFANPREKPIVSAFQNVLLLYYLPWCSACTSISHNYLYLSDVLYGSSTVHMARIDSNTNKLPLPFRVQTYPAIILYPANRCGCRLNFARGLDLRLALFQVKLLCGVSRRWRGEFAESAVVSVEKSIKASRKVTFVGYMHTRQGLPWDSACGV